MIATPAQRNRLMQKLKAETWIRRKNGISQSGTDEKMPISCCELSDLVSLL